MSGNSLSFSRSWLSLIGSKPSQCDRNLSYRGGTGLIGINHDCPNRDPDDDENVVRLRFLDLCFGVSLFAPSLSTPFTTGSERMSRCPR